VLSNIRQLKASIQPARLVIFLW